MGGWLRISGAVIVVVILITLVRSALMTDEDRILALVADAEDGWNDASAGQTVSVLADDFVLVPFHQGKSWLRTILWNIYQHNRDPKSKRFLFRATVDWDSIQLVFVNSERTYAQVRGKVNVDRTDGRDDWDYDGGFGFEARKRAGRWCIVSAGLQGLGEHRSRQRQKPPPGE